MEVPKVFATLTAAASDAVNLIATKVLACPQNSVSRMEVESDAKQITARPWRVLGGFVAHMEAGSAVVQRIVTSSPSMEAFVKPTAVANAVATLDAFAMRRSMAFASFTRTWHHRVCHLTVHRSVMTLGAIAPLSIMTISAEFTVVVSSNRLLLRRR